MDPVARSVTTLPGVGPVGARALADRGFHNVGDLVYLLPRRYDDERRPTPIATLEEGRHAVVLGVVGGVRRGGPPGGGGRLEVTLEPAPSEARGRVGALRLVWFRAPGGLAGRFRRGALVRAAGRVESYRGFLQMTHPETVRLDGPGDLPRGRIRARYPDVPGIAPRTLERAVRAAVERAASRIPDLVPEWLRLAQGVPSVAGSLERIHDPPDDLDDATLEAWNAGRTAEHERLALEELFLLELTLHRRRERESLNPAQRLVTGPATLTRAAEALPFALTGAQSRVVGEVTSDLARDRPMRRLLQGDVGSGKTAVAFLAAAHAVSAGAQVAFMVPTELLAEQQVRTFDRLGRELGMRVALVVGGARSAHRKKVRGQLEAGTLDVAVGTHALLTEGVEFRNLGLVIVDEQHRFGVAQRLRLVEKGAGSGSPHLLVMTATPIPRSLALAVYGDLDVSLLDELPPGRVAPVTRAYSRDARERALRQLRRALDAGGQAYVVCPAVEESEELDLRAATDTHAELAARFSDVGVELVHGRQDTDERQAAMARFASGEVRILVSTTVIEVGVDVPTANMMLVEDAERFGLAQLHQLRGRVGRGGQRSACLLVHRAGSAEAKERLRVLCETTDGFRIAEEDLRLRGPGELFGRRQSGLPGFRFADLRRDRPLLERARELARALLERDPDLEARENAEARRAVEGVETARAVVAEEAG